MSRGKTLESRGEPFSKAVFHFFFCKVNQTISLTLGDRRNIKGHCPIVTWNSPLRPVLHGYLRLNKQGLPIGLKFVPWSFSLLATQDDHSHPSSQDTKGLCSDASASLQGADPDKSLTAFSPDTFSGTNLPLLTFGHSSPGVARQSQAGLWVL